MPEDDRAVGCGISKIWLTSAHDPFVPACAWHDQAYIKGSKEQEEMTRKETDKAFLGWMLDIARSAPKWSRWLGFRAYVFYGITRLVGGWYWEGRK